MHALVGLGTSLCAKYDEPDKWLAGGCNCARALGGSAPLGTSAGYGCPDVRDALARVRARGAPAPTHVMPEGGELAGWTWAAVEDLATEVGWRVNGRPLDPSEGVDAQSAAEPENTSRGDVDPDAGTSRHFPARAFSGGAPQSRRDDESPDEAGPGMVPRFAPDGAGDEWSPAA